MASSIVLSRAPGTAVALLLVTLALGGSSASGAVPALMNYQGYLTGPGNSPLDGTFAMTFRLYADSTGGAPLWSESYAGVPVVAGVFNVLLGSVTSLPPSLVTGAKLWLHTEVDAVDLSPRRPIVTVAHAFRSAVADSAVTVPPGSGSRWTASGQDIYRASGNVGIGTTGPTTRLDVAGDLSVSGRINVAGSRILVLIGGWYCTSTGSMTGSVNPITGSASCPSGYAAATMFSTGGLTNCSAACATLTCFICYRLSP